MAKQTEKTEEIMGTAVTQSEAEFDFNAFLDEFSSDETGIVPAPDLPEHHESVSLPWVSVVQEGDTIAPRKMAEKIVFCDVTNDDERQYFDRITFMLVGGIMTESPYTHRMVEPRRMMIDRQTVCESNNGLVPVPMHVGKQVMDTRWQRMEVIGYARGADGALVPLNLENGSICERCPFNTFPKASETPGKQGGPMCQVRSRYIIYILNGYDGDDVIPVNRLATISGTKKGIQIALKGVKQGGYGSLKDGSELVGIEYFFHRTSPATADVVTYRNAPEGYPDVVRRFVPVYPVTMSSADNAFTDQHGAPNPTIVPVFSLSDTAMSMEEYVNYRRAIQTDYYQADVRSQYLRLDQIAQIIEANKNRTITIENDTPQLTGGGTATMDLDDLV